MSKLPLRETKGWAIFEAVWVTYAVMLLCLDFIDRAWVKWTLGGSIALWAVGTIVTQYYLQRAVHLLEDSSLSANVKK